MQDSQLISLLRTNIITGQAIVGLVDIPVIQAFQPRQQGVNDEPTIFLYKVGDRRYGYPYQGDVWDTDSSTIVHTQLQKYETTYQISALAIQDPSITGANTASDILNLVACALSDITIINTFEAQDVGILRITDVRNPYFTDERGRFESSPSMDITLTHERIITSTSNVLEEVELEIITV